QRQRNGAGVFVMLCLSHKVSGHKIRIDRLVRHDDHFARPCDHVDVHYAKNMTLGGCHVDIARSHDLVDSRNCCGAKGQCGHSLCSSNTIDLGEVQFL